MKGTSEMADDVSKVATMNEEVQGGELLPCPFCGETTRLVANAYGIERADETPEDRSHEVVCDGCGASGPERPPRSKAIAAWNRRASQQERGLEVSDEAVEAAAEVIWNDLYGARGGAWDNPPADSVTGIQMRATARAALLAASSVSPATGFARKLAAAQTDTDPDIAEATYGNRSALYVNLSEKNAAPQPSSTDSEVKL